MVNYSCSNCQKVFTQKGHYDKHLQRKRPCKKDNTIEKLVEEKVKEVLDKIRNKDTNIIENQQDTGKFRKNLKDQFYTNKDVSKKCIEEVINLFPFTSEYLWIEPSAGDGSFLYNVPEGFEKVGLDLDPRGDFIERQDYLEWDPPDNKDILIFGNPPFGRQSCLAKKFILKSCKTAKIIAFILPKSFTKPSMFNVFDINFHLIKTIELNRDTFILNGSKYHVPCVFQIWQKKDIPRKIEQKIIPVGFNYTKNTDKYDIALRRVGGNAGKCYKNKELTYNVQSHYFIKFDKNILANIDNIINRINYHIFPSNTVGPRSISKNEVNVILNDIISTYSS